MSETVSLLAGECTTEYQGRSTADDRTQRGRVVVVHKPDDTVLVHDAEGYQPVAWLTRADAVYREQSQSEQGNNQIALVAVKDGERLRVQAHDVEQVEMEGTAAGSPVGTCPNCRSPLVRARGAVTCLGCETEHGLPRDAAVLETTCDCGLPEMTVERGDRFELCVDRTCENLDEAIRKRFDREWPCPDCDGDLRVLREGALFLGCENYPDCDASLGLPKERVVGTCECGLPKVGSGVGSDSDGDAGPRCLGDCGETAET
ncbi:topoisomerase DNA-binding C4 zinc finger domain-containing protein [Halorussus halophilus]|uniref:topoisomerase DNA-binding C4 zinc finger domain-containing protein n=1 Tax=Halorussus halophilus TaxID=2650975 RepID=UPI0013012F6C|nr:topoisomerase DNA-binding C4 zinc finger domain-containing protein [Halorussus halophilus]